HKRSRPIDAPYTTTARDEGLAAEPLPVVEACPQCCLKCYCPLWTSCVARWCCMLLAVGCCCMDVA
ncbi:hypothetical protein Dimus_000321, partial [Dionaea muscipula]